MKYTLRHITTLLATCLLLASALSACKKTVAATTDAIAIVTDSNLEEITPKKIAVSPSKLVLSIGEYSKLSVSGIYPYGQSGLITSNLTWLAADTSIIDVDSSGIALGKKEGTTFLRVEKLGTAATIEVTVTPASMTQIIVFPENPKVVLKAKLGQPVPQPFKLEAYGLLTNGQLIPLPADQVTWLSSKEDALVWSDTDGAVAKAPGHWTMTAKYGILEKVKDIEVSQTPIAVDHLEALESPIILRYGATKTITFVAHMNDESIITNVSAAVPTPNNTTQLIVPSGLQIKAIGSGNTTVKVMMGGKALDIPVYIEEASVTSITLEPATISLHRGEVQPFVATAHFSDGTNANITTAMTATSSDPVVMSISGSSVKGETIGSSNLNISYKGAFAQIFVNVDAPALAKLEIVPSTFTLVAGYTQTFQVWGVKTNGDRFNLSANTDVNKGVPLAAIGEVLPGNTLHAKSKGITSLSATYTDPATNKPISGSATVTVSDPVLVSISFDPPTSTQPAGRFQDFRIKGLYSDNNEVDITSTAKITIDTFSDPTYSYAATVLMSPSALVRVKGVKPGKMKVIATLESISGSMVFTSIAKIIESVSIVRTDGNTTSSMDKGTTATLIAQANYSDGSTSNITTGAGPARTVNWFATADTNVATLTLVGNQMRVSTVYQGAATFDLQVIDTDPLVGTVSDSYTMSVYVPCSGSGIRRGVSCIFLGASDASCNQTCDAQLRPNASHRVYDPATFNTFGAGATSDTECSNAVNQDFSNVVTPQAAFSNTATTTEFVGCSIAVDSNVDIGVRASVPPLPSPNPYNPTMSDVDVATAADPDGYASLFRRICACE